MIIKEIVYNGYRNTIEIAISIEGSTVPINHNLLTRCQLNMNGVLLDSAVNPTYFDKTLPDRLILKLGSAGLAAKNYNATLIVFDDTSVEGLVVGSFFVTVV